MGTSLLSPAKIAVGCSATQSLLSGSTERRLVALGSLEVKDLCIGTSIRVHGGPLSKRWACIQACMWQAYGTKGTHVHVQRLWDCEILEPRRCAGSYTDHERRRDWRPDNHCAHRPLCLIAALAAQAVSAERQALRRLSLRTCIPEQVRVPILEQPCSRLADQTGSCLSAELCPSKPLTGLGGGGGVQPSRPLARGA